MQPSIKRIYSHIFAICFFIWSGAASAIEYAVDVHGGTLGSGVGGTMSLIRHVNLRAGINSGELDIYSFDEQDGFDYDDLGAEYDNQYIFIDFHPWRRGSFRMTAGVVFNKNTYTTGARVVDSSAFIGNSQAPVSASASVETSYAKRSGYFGVGWGNAVTRGLPVRFGIDVGLLFQGEPSTDLTINDPTSTVTAADAELERQELEEDFEIFEIWPVISFSIGYRF